MNDMIHEECGVFGAVTNSDEAAGITYNALIALQHRGQEGAGSPFCATAPFCIIRMLVLSTRCLLNRYWSICPRRIWRSAMSVTPQRERIPVKTHSRW